MPTTTMYQPATQGIALIALAATIVIFLPRTSVVSAAESVDIPALLLQPSVNLVLSVGDVAKSKAFYGDVLRLKPMANLNLPGGFVMTRYLVGTTEIKFLHNPALEKTENPKPDEANGIRRLTLFCADEAALVEQFEAHDLPAPKFESDPAVKGWRQALVYDPDGNQLALVIPPAGTSEEVFNNIEVGLTVSDLEASRKFYRDFVGFAEVEPGSPRTADAAERYSYRHGNTTITLASFGDQLPTRSGRWEKAHGIRYIQYIVRDLDAVNEYAKASGVTIAQEIFPLGKLARIMFIADPDGVINEFVGLPKAR